MFFGFVYQIGSANPRLQKVLDALDDIKSKVLRHLLSLCIRIFTRPI